MGLRSARAPGAEDDGVMNMRGFHDLNEHQWPFIYMDMSAILEA